MSTTHDKVAPPNAIVSTTQITREIAQQVLATIDQGLSRGRRLGVEPRHCLAPHLKPSSPDRAGGFTRLVPVAGASLEFNVHF